MAVLFVLCSFCIHHLGERGAFSSDAEVLATSADWIKSLTSDSDEAAACFTEIDNCLNAARLPLLCQQFSQ